MSLDHLVSIVSSSPPITLCIKIQQADIEVNTIYFDEAHNSVQRNFFPATEHFSADADRCYFFTATPKHSLTVFKPGMNDTEVYGQVICNVPAPHLVEEGYILPPKVVVKELPTGDQRQSDCKNLIDTIDDNSLNKILIAARSTKQIVKLVKESDFAINYRNVDTTGCSSPARLVLSSMARRYLVRSSSTLSTSGVRMRHDLL